MMRRRIALLFAASALLLAGCGSLGYYAQALSGHLDVMQRRQPVATLLASPDTPAPLRAQLTRAVALRDFAVRELALPDNDSYRVYADLGRPFVVWNVFAAPEFSVELQHNCFVLVGCVAYRGYYDRADAQRRAEMLRRAGDDVYVGGVPAYSTLGWFDDPLLNTFIAWPQVELARLMFHELAHQVVFVRGDTQFNESFAVTVEREGVRRWLALEGNAAERAAGAQWRARRDGFIALVQRYRDMLAQWYATPRDAAAMRAGKMRMLAQMRVDYAALKASWGGFSGYDRWFAHDLNNAQIASVAVYTHDVPAFEALLARESGDLRRFYAAVRALAEQGKTARQTQLAELESSRAGRAIEATESVRFTTSAPAEPIAR